MRPHLVIEPDRGWKSAGMGEGNLKAVTQKMKGSTLSRWTNLNTQTKVLSFTVHTTNMGKTDGFDHIL